MWLFGASPCSVRRAGVPLNVDGDAADDSVEASEQRRRPGAAARRVLTRLIEGDGLSCGQRQDLEFVLETFDDLARRLTRSASASSSFSVPAARPRSKRRVSTIGDGAASLMLDESTQRYLRSFAPDGVMRRWSLRTAAIAIIFLLRLPRHLKERTGRYRKKEQLIVFDMPVQRVLERLNSWDSFDVFLLTSVTQGQPLSHVALAAMQLRGLVNTFNLPAQELRTFLKEMERTYLSNPYHNSTHAADVTQAVHLFLGDLAFSELEKLAGLMAAVCHDAGHPGTTNDFRVLSDDDVALTYNDRSVNENMHCALSFRLLRKSQCNFTQALGSDQRRLLRKMVISSVLATDMAVHFAEFGRFKETIEVSGRDIAAWEDRQLALSHALHGADLSNVCRPERIVRRWTDMVLAEFFEQGDRERAMGRPVSPLCDRHTVSKPDSQIGFIGFIVRPFFEALHGLLDVAQPLEQLAVTCEMWSGEKEKLDGVAERNGEAPPTRRSVGLWSSRSSVISIR